ncbi:hypothetical protein VNO77_20254 [Canavalia gladiata]|uniref:Uncharacterized protein n=1 Tax=Canavalia gladiata TaxID=3824 RepID=A0AAN9LT38_CANGL
MGALIMRADPLPFPENCSSGLEFLGGVTLLPKQLHMKLSQGYLHRLINKEAYDGLCNHQVQSLDSNDTFGIQGG